MKRLPIILSLAFIISFGVSTQQVAAQAEMQIVIDELISVKKRTPNRNKYSDNLKKIEKNKPKIRAKSRYDCLSYGLWSSKAIDKRQKQLKKQRKHFLAKN